MYQDKNESYFSSTRMVILSLLSTQVDRVLEIGCGTGETLGMLKKNGLCKTAIGIELFEDAAIKSNSIVDKVYCLDVEKNSLPNDFGRFQLILLLDVLEHLVNPWDFLDKLKNECLDTNGTIIISLPNARHFSLVLPLLMGRFDYQERGILDKTHLRFFTKKSMLELINGAGLKVDKVKRTSLEVKLNSGKFNIMTFGLISDFLTSQYIFSCTLNTKL